MLSIHCQFTMETQRPLSINLCVLGGFVVNNFGDIIQFLTLFGFKN